MPRGTAYTAIATKSTIEALFAQVETQGSLLLRFPDFRAMTVFRQRLYSYRSKMRKQMMENHGTEVTHLDSITIAWSDEHDPDLGRKTGKILLELSYDAPVEFELLIPDYWEGPIPFMDTGPDATGQINEDEHLGFIETMG